jgi:hypothetical protein
MRLVTYDRGGARRLGAWVSEAVVDLPDAVGHPAFPTTMESLVSCAGGTTMEAAVDALGRPDYWEPCVIRRPRLLVPVLPPLLDAAWLYPPGGVVPRPTNGRLGYEVKLAAVVGPSGHDRGDQPGTPIFGYTLVLAWTTAALVSGRMVRSFAGAFVGPAIVTSDEFVPDGLELTVRRDGERQASVAVRTMLRGFAELVERAHAPDRLRPGQVVGTRAALRAREGVSGPGLRPGTVVEAAVEGIGTLRAVVGDVQTSTGPSVTRSPDGIAGRPPASTETADRRASLRLLTLARPAGDRAAP